MTALLKKYTAIKYAVALAAAMLLASTVSCHHIEDYDNTATDNFELLWKLFDEHYCFFGQKGDVDWNEVHGRYAARVDACSTYRELFTLCANMCNELRDGHVNLSSSFATSYYKEWWSDYPQNYDKRVVEENYLFFRGTQVGPITYAVLPQNVAYVSIPTFATGIGEGNLDWVLAYLQTCSGLIVDVRDNGGGSMTNVETWVSRFLRQRTLVGYIIHKTGPGHTDFSEPYAYYYAPPADRQLWTKPVAVLTNRSTFSAANNFVSVMKLLPGVTVIGDTTGGGCGMPLTFDLPCGWTVRMSAAPVLDARGNPTEFGVDPTPGYDIDITAMDTAAGRDPILEAAVALLSGNSGGMPVQTAR